MAIVVMVIAVIVKVVMVNAVMVNVVMLDVVIFNAVNDVMVLILFCSDFDAILMGAFLFENTKH